MSTQPTDVFLAGLHTFGPGNATLSVLTSRTGVAAKAGHDLILEVTSWDATLEVHADPAACCLELDANGASLRVREGTGGIKPLEEDDKATIEATIDGILERRPIRFRSTRVQLDAADRVIHARGDLELLGRARPIAFDVAVRPDGTLAATISLQQTDWDIQPYSTLFGTLQVADVVTLAFEGAPSAR